MNESNHEKLRQHFALRVTNQVRQVLDLWRQLSATAWTQEWLNDFQNAIDKLIQTAHRFEASEHEVKAKLISKILHTIHLETEAPSSKQITLLNDAIYGLSQATLRKSDGNTNIDSAIPVKKPIYVALNSPRDSEILVTQLGYFGFRAEALTTRLELQDHLNRRYPAALILDTDFDTGDEPQAALQLISEFQDNADNKLPILFYSTDDTLETRLAAVRAGAVAFYTELDFSQVVTQVEDVTRILPSEPYRVLIVDDSKSQATYCQRALNKAGMITQTVIDPMTLTSAMQDFQPELILMDMYMPGCSGIELAQVIRQQPQYVSIPIIYLSGEEDRDKQLNAMSQGADDFLTKPVDPRHLTITVQNRGQRARALHAQMIRDSLTGLYNHTYILETLDKEIDKAYRMETPLLFAMIDIDHFKLVNDTYGHPVGDRVICSLSMFLKQRLRKTDTLGRYGGEEFAVILPNTTLTDAAKAIDEIRARFQQIIQPADEKDFSVSFSCGISQLTADNREHIIEQADEALYKAKEDGRNCVRAFAV